MLGIGEGRAVGEALAFLLDLRLDEGLLAPTKRARRLRQWWTDRDVTRARRAERPSGEREATCLLCGPAR